MLIKRTAPTGQGSRAEDFLRDKYLVQPNCAGFVRAISTPQAVFWQVRHAGNAHSMPARWLKCILVGTPGTPSQFVPFWDCR